MGCGGGADKSGASLGDNEQDNGEDHPRGHCAHLERTDIPPWQNLCDEEVIHVEQGVERQGEEEEGASLLAVCGVVVPQDKAGQGRQDEDAQEVVQSCKLQQEGQQQQNGDQGDLQVASHGFQDSRAASAWRGPVF